MIEGRFLILKDTRNQELQTLNQINSDLRINSAYWFLILRIGGIENQFYEN